MYHYGEYRYGQCRYAECRGAQAMSQTFFLLRTNKLERLGPANCFSLVYHSSVKPEPGSTKKFEDIIFVCNFRLLPLWNFLD